jgi:hypothetical protein
MCVLRTVREGEGSLSVSLPCTLGRKPSLLQLVGGRSGAASLLLLSLTHCVSVSKLPSGLPFPQVEKAGLFPLELFALENLRGHAQRRLFLHPQLQP